MLRLLVKWLALTLTILMVPSLVGGVTVDSFGTALAVAAVLGVLNVLLKPLLIVLTLPFTILSLGLFLFVINAILFQIAGKIIPGLHVASFGSAFFASLIVSLVSWILNRVGEDHNGSPRVKFFFYRGGNPPPSGGGESNRPVRDINRIEP